MGRNFFSVCNLCKVQLMHFRGREGDNMQKFANDHMGHGYRVEVLDDYVDEPPEGYKDVFDDYNAEWLQKLDERRANSKPKRKLANKKEKS